MNKEEFIKERIKKLKNDIEYHREKLESLEMELEVWEK